MAVITRDKDTPRIPGRPTDEARALAEAIFDAESRTVEEQPLRRPAATYRLQVHAGFTLDDVSRVVDYLADLGITDGYLSPYLSARPGSTHGYDVFDHRRINAEIGDRQAHDRLLLKLKERGMGRVLDIVPNHMGVAGLNPFWMDVLELGPQSPYACYFDIEWKPLEDDLDGRVLLPILEDQYGRVLESGKLVLKRDQGRFLISYGERELPIAPRSYATILEYRLDDLREMGEAEEDVQEVRSLAASARLLPSSSHVDAESVERVGFERDVIKSRLRRLVEESPRIAAYLDETLEVFQGRPGEATSFDPLHSLLEQQVYRLSSWRVASEEINYRRFFDINDLAGLRAEDPRVFEATHARIFRWIGEGGVTGLRIDHPDGLADPAGYLRRIQERLFLRACHDRYRVESKQSADWQTVGRLIRDRYRSVLDKEPRSALARRFPVVVEKILTRDEPVPDDWTIDGTVGYEFLNALNGLFVAQEAKESILATYREFTGESTRFAEILFDAKRLITRSSLASERNALASKLARIAARDRRSRDFTRAELGRALGTIMAIFPVYRAYLQPGESATVRDRKMIERAVANARKRNPTIDPSVFDFVRSILLNEHPEGLPTAEIARREAFTIRFQQTTGPIQAKGLEDTTFYRYVPLVSLNEVGGDPSRFGTTPDAFHNKNSRRLKRWAGGFLATATHDTKRGEDARIRINTLSELPEAWKEALARWSAANAPLKHETPRGLAPDAREEYLFYQTLIGSWPFGMEVDAITPEYVERVQAYMIKAAREAKVKTSWTDADPAHCEALKAFVAEALSIEKSGAFLQDFRSFQGRIELVGAVHSLSQSLIKLTSPGVADVYQGCELWDLSLVDPDNRRPVDFDRRAAFLADFKSRLERGEDRGMLASALLAAPEDGAIKLYLHWVALNHRRSNADLYRLGEYLPLQVTGPHAHRVIAFARRLEGRTVVVVAPRLVVPLMDSEGDRMPIGTVWESTSIVLPQELQSQAWHDLLTDRRGSSGAGTLALADLFATLPVALLELTS
jgi:(1->4)-alpha-D-glucan 1-alpha-D-glucosylmutase